MGGVAKTVKSTAKKIVSSPTRFGTALVTGGASELLRMNPLADKGLSMVDKGVDSIFKRQNARDLPGVNGGQDPATLLSQNGGAPLLANIAMGVDPEDALAGYFGKNKKDGSWAEFLDTLSQKDLDSINSVHGQLNTIQGDRNLRQQAVDKVIGDYPNLAKNAAQARAQAGGEFDEVTKGYMDQALNSKSAQLSANGQLNSGAANEAYARVGAEQGMQKLSYMGDREQNAYNMGANELNVRLNEVNALRDFQNTMLTGQVAQGFSAQQANLQRQFQGQMANADMANQRNMADQAGKNAMFGAIGQLGGAAVGAYLLGPAGGMAGSKIGAGLFGSPSGQSGMMANNKLNLNTPQSDSSLLRRY